MGLRKTTKEISSKYYWKDLRKDVRNYVLTCPICQTTKASNEPPLGTSRPLPPPEGPWQSVTMDFITPLPLTRRGNNALFVVVNRFSKMMHVTPTCPGFAAPDIARLYHDHIYRYHGLPKEIISDRDSVFTSLFLTTMHTLLKVKLKPSSAYHPETDGQTEIVNRKIEEMLRCYVDQNQSDWDEFLTDIEVACNHSVHSTTTFTPVFLNYGYEPRILPFDTLTLHPIKLPSVSKWLRLLSKSQRAAITAVMKSNDKMAAYANQHRRPCHLSEGDLVLLSTKHFLPEAYTGARKLMPKYFGPFPIKKAISGVTFQLDLPPALLARKVHNAFHAKLLKPYKADLHSERNRMPPPPDVMPDGSLEYEVERIIRKRTRKGRPEYLIKYREFPDYENEWLSIEELSNCKKILTEFERGRLQGGDM